MEKKQLVNRLNRIEGQIKGIRTMLEDGRYCDDILVQVAAVTSSLKSFGLVLLDSHMKSCVAQKLAEGHTEVLDEVMQTIRKLNR